MKKPEKDIVLFGDAEEKLATLPDESVHLTFTSPPYYNARDYVTYASYEAYLDKMSRIFEQVLRLTMPGRYLVVNSSPVLIPRSHRNANSRRLPIPYDLHGRLRDIGWEFVDDIVWVKPSGAAKNRNENFTRVRKPLTYRPNAITEMLMVYKRPCPKTASALLGKYADETIESSKVHGDIELSNVWFFAPESNPHHSAVFPLPLCRQVVALYSLVGDTVLDPFAGSGTVGRAARELGRHFVLVELNRKYEHLITKNTLAENLF